MSPTAASMGSSSETSEFGAVKSRMNTALDTLRTELKAIHEQDLSLLRQLMHIHHTITLLTGAKNRRSASSSCASSSPVPESPSRTERSHVCLSRGQSLPFRADERDLDDEDEDDDDSDEDEDDDEDEDSEEEDMLSLSINSNVSDPLGHSMNLQDHGDYSMFYPLPLNLQRPPLFCSPQSDSTDDVTSCQPDTANDVTLPDDVTTDPSNLVQLRSFIPYEPIRTQEKPLTKYDLSSSAYLKRSSQLWREVQKEQEETGTVDEKKMATLSVFL